MMSLSSESTLEGDVNRSGSGGGNKEVMEKLEYAFL